MPEPRSAPSVETVKKSRILVVDDDPINLLVIDEILSKRFAISTAADAEEASRLAEDFKPDLVLIDLMVHDNSGYEICRMLRGHPKLRFTKIILVSTKSLLKDRLFGYEAGADDYIARPFDPDELLAKVNVFIRLKSVEEIDRVKDDLINIFSHETRTPLNAIIGFSRLLCESPSLAPEEKEFVKLITESGLSLLSLSNKAILLSTLRKENRTLSRFPASLPAIVQNSLKNLPDALKEKGIKVETRIQDAVLYVDEQLIENAMTYLVENAHKFSPEGSKACIFTENASDGSLAVRVKDQGCGIPPARLTEIFDEFGIEDVSHHGRGHGLSLSIVKNVMELHEGKVTAANNTDGPGSVFSLVFTSQSLTPHEASGEPATPG